MTLNSTKNILITGTSSGLGKELALFLASKGFHVFVTLRDYAQFEIYKDIENISCLILDVCKSETIDAAEKQILKETQNKGIDVLINNAGVVVSGPLEHLDLEEIKHLFEVNIFGVLAVTKKMLPQLKQNQGKIINIGSMSSRMAIPFIGAYGASKSALKQFSWSLRIELKPWKVGVYHLELGNFASEIWNKSLADKFEDYAPYMQGIQQMMSSRKDSFNSIELLLQKTLATIQGKNSRFNSIVGKDAQMRRFLTTVAPYKILEMNLLSKLRIG